MTRDHKQFFVFRVDVSSRLGYWHVMSYLTLVNVLWKLGAPVAFVCRADEDNLSDLICNSGFVVYRLSIPPTIEAALAGWFGYQCVYAVWLGVAQQQDAENYWCSTGQTPRLVIRQY